MPLNDNRAVVVDKNRASDKALNEPKLGLITELVMSTRLHTNNIVQLFRVRVQDELCRKYVLSSVSQPFPSLYEARARLGLDQFYVRGFITGLAKKH